MNGHMCSLNHCIGCGACIPSPLFKCSNCAGVTNTGNISYSPPRDNPSDVWIVHKLDRIIELLEKEPKDEKEKTSPPL